MASVMRVSATGEMQLIWMLYGFISLATLNVRVMMPPLALA